MHAKSTLLDRFDSTVVSKIEHAITQHQRFANISFKILDLNEKEIIVKTVQGKSSAENYASKKHLIDLTKDLFSPLGREVHVHATPYAEPELSRVNAAWIRDKMDEYGVSVGDIVKQTDVDRTNISAWINDKRPMSRPVKAMFWFYFRTLPLTISSITRRKVSGSQLREQARQQYKNRKE